MRGSIRKRGKSYTLTIDTGKDADGKRVQHFQTFRTLAMAEAALGEMLKQAQDGILGKPTRLTTGKYLQQWLEDYAAIHVRPTTLRGYRSIVEHHLIPAIGTVPLASLQPHHVQHAQRRALEAGLSARTVIQHHRVLSEALKHAESWGMVNRNVAGLVKPPRPSYHEARFLDADEAARLIDSARGTRYFIPLALSLMTGLRRGELLGLQWRDVDLDKDSIQVNRALHYLPGRGLLFQEVKSVHSRRQVALSPNAALLLRSHRERVEATEAEAGGSLAPNALVFGLPTGRPLSPNTLTHAFHRIARAAGIEGAHLHSLRHSHASLLLSQGASLKDIQARLGHSTIAITADLYAHITEQQRRETAAKFDQALDVTKQLVSNS